MQYDYIIVGGGPTGLTIAWCLAKYNKKVLVIEREDDIGGCHRVRRVNALFTEHGPRIYLGNSKTFNFILDDMNMSFDGLFTEYKFNTANVGVQIFKLFKFNELVALAKEYAYFIIRPDYSKNISIGKFMDDNNFEQKTKDFIDKLCRITDGAASDRYTLYEFLEIINQNIFYKIYQPRIPNDMGLFKQWRQALINTGNVNIWTSTQVDKIEIADNKITGLSVVHKTLDGETKTTVYAHDYIFAIPPKSLLDVIQKSTGVENAFGNFDRFLEWEKATEYLLFIPVVFHWNVKLDVETLWGIPASDWGIGSIVLSNYMQFGDMRSKTVITTCVSMPEKRSSVLGKTAHECTKEELIEEVFRQLKEIYANTNMIRYSHAFVSPEMHKKDDKWNPSGQSLTQQSLTQQSLTQQWTPSGQSLTQQWTSVDSAYVRTSNGFMGMKSVLFNNLYSVGTHNGEHFYNFTSIESAVSNAVACVNQLVPESKDKYKVIKFVTLNNIIVLVFIISALLLIYKFSVKHNTSS